MCIQNGKFYDARRMREFCDGLKNAVLEYDDLAETTHREFASFHSTEGFMGATAIETKKFIKDGIGNMLKTVSESQNQMVKAQTEMITLFETMVDSSQNARIEYDVLEMINKDFRNMYFIYKDSAEKVKKLVDGLNSEFGNYAYFEQPNSKSGIDAFIDFCGGDNDHAGFLRECQNKLAAYDEAAKALLNEKDTMTKVEKVDSCIVNTKAALSAEFMSGMNYNITPIMPLSIIDYKKLAILLSSGAIQAASYLNDLKDKIATMSQEKFFEFIDSLDIPHTWTNEQVLLFFELTEMNISSKATEANAAHNEQYLTNSVLGNGYIENQAYWGDIHYGKSNIAYSGCEIIATYNAIYDLTGSGGSDEMVKMISYFEQNGSSLYGGFGTSPKAVQEYLETQGYTTEMTCKTDSESIEAIQDGYDTYIVTAYNDENKLSSEVHTVSITEDNGKYIIHNDYYYNSSKNKYDSKGSYDSLEDAIDAINKDSQMISLIGVNAPILGDFPESEEYSA